jgi:hypothetical protein
MTLQTFFHVKIKFYQGWWKTKQVQKIVLDAKADQNELFSCCGRKSV